MYLQYEHMSNWPDPEIMPLIQYVKFNWLQSLRSLGDIISVTFLIDKWTFQNIGQHKSYCAFVYYTILDMEKHSHFFHMH